ncbi:transcription factor HHO6 [Lycium ferocissimum]|uniref:transcription factor HHO6 n=1 Tax=Lycium ferocissimum TaxID=112874 RepID=UPI0028149B1A|nr:transcription factor HHO6 [Lycium ferocissimum]
MGSIGPPPELSLDCKPTFIPTSITDFLRQLSLIHNVPDKLSQIDDYITRLEDEMRKIDAFKRELPLCVLLVKDAIVALRAESAHYRKSRKEPVLEEFIPLKKSSNEDTKAEIIKDKDNSREKMSWMSSVQLWNGDQNTDEANNKQRSKSELKLDTQRSPEEGNSSVTEDPFQSCKAMNTGKAFSPFKGLSSFSVTAVRKDNKDELPGVPGLSLHTPGITKLREDTVTSGLNTKHNGSGGGLSSVAGCQSNVIRTGSLAQQQSASRKQRRCWSPELHRRFVDALQQLGGSQVATPKQIRELMQVDGLTNDEVKSHLQKYRLHTRRIPNTQAQSANQSGVTLGNLWMSQGQYGESSKQSSSQSGSPQGPLHLGGSSRGTSTTLCDSMEEEDDVKSESHSWKNHAHTSGKIDV